MLNSPVFAGSEEPCLDLIGDQDDIVLVADLSEVL